jgi:hypothetical protein
MIKNNSLNKKNLYIIAHIVNNWFMLVNEMNFLLKI